MVLKHRCFGAPLNGASSRQAYNQIQGWNKAVVQARKALSITGEELEHQCLQRDTAVELARVEWALT